MMNDRKITMQAMRYLSQVAEAISSQVMRGAPGATHAAEASMRCSDHAEHIAQYDIEGLAQEVRMQGIAESMEWLMVIVRQHNDMLTASRLAVPSAAELDAVASAAAAIELHADKLSPTSSYATNAGQPTFKFDVAAQSDELVKHSVTFGKTADAHKGLAQSYQQMGVTATEFSDLQPKP